MKPCTLDTHDSLMRVNLAVSPILMPGLAVMLLLVILAGSGCSTAVQSDHGGEPGLVSSRQNDEGLSAWERERRDQQDRLNDDRRRYSTGERR